MNSLLDIVLKENYTYFNIAIQNIKLYGTISYVEHCHEIQCLLYKLKWL